MRAKYAREIRAGITLAEQVINRERTSNRAPHMLDNSLFSRAYHHTFDQAVRSGRLGWPKEPSPSYQPKGV